MTAIVSFLHVLDVIQPEQVIINKLNRFFDIDHNIFLMDVSVDINRFVATTTSHEDCTPQSVYTFSNATSLGNLNKVRSNNELLVLIPKASDFNENFNLLMRAKQIQEENINLKIGIIFPRFTGDGDLMELFKWSWKHRIINIFAVTHENGSTTSSLNIFSYSPFGTFRVINVTNKSFDHYFMSQRSNFQQFELQIADSNQWDRLGRTQNSWSTVFQVMNCTPKYWNNWNIADPMIDVSANMYTRFSLNAGVHIAEMPSFVILVPEAMPYSELVSYFQNILSNEVSVYTIITIVTTILLLGIVRYKKSKKGQFFESAADVLNLLMNDNGGVKYQHLNRMEGCIIVPLTFVGLIIINGILSSLQSHITRPFLQYQMNTLEDIYRAPIPVVTIHETFQKNLVGLFENRTKYTDWFDKIVILNKTIVDVQRPLFNRSVMYVTQDDIAHRMITIQKQLQIPGYHITQRGILRSFACFVANKEFQFNERLKEIFNLIKSAGLYDLWFRQDDLQKEKKILRINLKRLEDERKDIDGNVDSFSMPMFLVYGWIASSILFVGEIIFFKLLAKFTDKLRLRIYPLKK